MLGTLLNPDDFSLSYVDTKLGEVDFDVGETERKPSETSEPDFLRHAFLSCPMYREELPASRNLRIICDRNKLMCKMTTPSSQR